MFQESLKRLVQETDGGLAALLMGFDGIAVDSFVGNAMTSDMNTVGMEFSFILSQVRKATEILELGSVVELTIRAEKLTIMIRVMTPEYFLAIAIQPEGNLGKGRYLLRVLAPKFQAEL